MLAIASSTYTRVEIDTLIANIPSSSTNGNGYSNTQINTLLSDKHDNLLNASTQTGKKTYPLLLNNTIKQFRFEAPLSVSEELDNRITVKVFNSQIMFTSSLTFEDVENLSVNTLEMKGGTSGIQIMDFNSNPLMSLDNTQVSVNKPLVCTGDITASNYIMKQKFTH